jgi:GT2 family glycosyltransferase
MAFWRHCLLDVKGFDRAYTKRGCWREETDLCVRVRAKGYRIFYSSAAQVAHRAARWNNPIERLAPGRISGMVEDDAYFRVKNFGYAGLIGTLHTAMKDAFLRLRMSAINFGLIFVHLFAWIPGAIRGLLSPDPHAGTLGSK